MDTRSSEVASFENTGHTTDLQIVMMVAAAMAEMRSRAHEHDPGVSPVERSRKPSR